LVFIKQCLNELERLTGGHYRHDSLYFSLNEIKHLPKIIQNLNYMDSLAITPFHITDNSIMEAYWLALSIKVVDVVRDKNIVLLNEAGKSSLEEIEEKYIEQWDYTYYEILKDDVNGFIECLNRYISYMEIREVSLRDEYDMPNHYEEGTYYELW
jgi:hypothetical protein